ncbi:glycosyltransferase [Clostridium butyricum]|uniref:glycosyltransferase n=1 Tax=Clostridium butyricum TaxID=1492 RepID=UPI00374E7752
MITDKPLVSILLAVYKPNDNWLIEQLISLNKQNYENLNLYVYDDCPEYPTNTEIFNKYITNFEYKIIRGEVNKGSNKAFEELTKIADGDFFAYCDQDDIWETNKISLMMDEFTEDVTLVCCDLSIIDENSNKTHESLCDIRKRIVYKSGYGLAKDLLMTNFVTGCAMIVKKNIAIKAIPFIDELVHDQWIAIIAALGRKIKFVDKSLVRYRQHNNNQTGILTGVVDKTSYYEKRIDDFYRRYLSYKKAIGNEEEVKQTICESIKWIEARKRYSQKISFEDLKIMIKYRDIHEVSILIESILPFIPNFIFKYIIKLTKKGLL